jgi:hypothetical protein
LRRWNWLANASSQHLLQLIHATRECGNLLTQLLELCELARIVHLTLE